MLIIHNNSRTEPLQHYKDLTVPERVNGEHSLSFVLFGNDEYYDLVVEESIVEYENQEYRIKKIDERSKGHSSLKSVKAQHVFFDLIDEYQFEMIGGNYTLQALLDFALVGTDFTATVEGLVDERIVFNFGDANVLKLVQSACKLWGAEWELNNRHITVKAQVGRITDNQFRFKSNLKAIRKNVDTSKLATKIRGYYRNGYVEYTSPMADIYGIRHAEPIRNDEITDEAVMIDLLKRELIDQPNLSITVELAQLDFDVQKGDEIILIYEPLNIEMTARITQLERHPEQPKASKVTIANYNETVADVMAMFAKNIEQVEKKNEINRSEIRQSNEEIALRVTKETYDTDINDGTNGLKARMNEAELKITDDAIVSTVTSSTAYTSDISGLDTRLTDAESSITQNADNIALKVSETDFNGDEIASRINMTSTTITIDASKIDLNGKVTFTHFDKTTQDTINAKADSSDLGALAGLDVVEKARLGTTVIDGGYISADLLLADRITAGSLSTTAQINVGTDAYIGNNIYLGDQTSNLAKSIYFNDTANIRCGDGETKANATFNFSRINYGFSEHYAMYGYRLRNYGFYSTVDFTIDSDVNTRLNSNNITTASSETGFCGIGARHDAATTGSVAGTGVNYRIGKTYTPSSVSLSPTSYTASPNITNITSHGFWIWVNGTGVSGGYPYWRGYYTC